LIIYLHIGSKYLIKLYNIRIFDSLSRLNVEERGISHPRIVR
jgi:hypothetical protein